VWIFWGDLGVLGAKGCAGPLFRNIEVIAEFRGSLAASPGRKGNKEEGDSQNRKKFSTHR
jgi:hypothetical protein